MTRLLQAARALRPVRRRLLLFFLPWLAIFSIGVPLVWQELRQSLERPLLRAQADFLDQGTQILGRTLATVRRDATFLAQMLGGGLGDTPVATKLLYTVTTNGGNYAQTRWVDERGDERIRIELRDGHARIAGAAELRNEAGAAYFVDARTLTADQFHVAGFGTGLPGAPTTLPLLRAVTPVMDGEQRRGLVVLDYQAQRLLDRLGGLGRTLDFNTFLVDHQGRWLMHPGNGDAPAALPIARPALWTQIGGQARGLHRDPDGIWAHARFSPAEDADNGQRAWTLIVQVPEGVLAPVESRWLLMLALLSAVALIAAFWLSARLAWSVHQVEARSAELARANTELERNIVNLRALQAQLARADKLSSLGLMVAGVAHELNTPLGSALMALSTAREGVATLEAQIGTGLRKSDLTSFLATSHEGLELAHRAVSRAADLVRRFKQVAIDRTTMERRSFDLAEVIVDTDHRLHRWKPGSPVSLELKLAPGLQMESYPGPLGQVVTNLLDNALTHAFPEQRPGAITLEAAAEGPDHVRITLADNGVGIPADAIERVFDPFFTTRRHAGGTGLGLHVTHQIVTDLLGGQIEVESQQGGASSGTRFSLLLPRVAPPHAPAH